MKRLPVISTVLFACCFFFAAPKIQAQSTKLILEVMESSDVLVVLSPDKGGEATEIISDMQKVEAVITHHAWRKDQVEVIVGPKIDTKSDILPNVEKMLTTMGAERIIFYKAKGNFIVIGEKLPVLKDIKKKK